LTEASTRNEGEANLLVSLHNSIGAEPGKPGSFIGFRPRRLSLEAFNDRMRTKGGARTPTVDDVAGAFGLHVESLIIARGLDAATRHLTQSLPQGRHNAEKTAAMKEALHAVATVQGLFGTLAPSLDAKDAQIILADTEQRTRVLKTVGAVFPRERALIGALSHFAEQTRTHLEKEAYYRAEDLHRENQKEEVALRLKARGLPDNPRRDPARVDAISEGLSSAREALKPYIMVTRPLSDADRRLEAAARTIEALSRPTLQFVPGSLQEQSQTPAGKEIPADRGWAGARPLQAPPASHVLH
jgi:hypothetical protein